MNARTVIATGTLTFTTLTAVACVPPQPADINGMPARARWDSWVAANVTHVRPTTLGGTGGYYDPGTRSAILAVETIERWDSAYPGMGSWVEVHEDGHAFVLDHGLRYGGEFLQDQERGANCVAEVVAGRDFPAERVDEASGYWACPDWAIEVTRSAMVEAGAWA